MTGEGHFSADYRFRTKDMDVHDVRIYHIAEPATDVAFPALAQNHTMSPCSSSRQCAT